MKAVTAAGARGRWLVTLVLVSTVACSSKASQQQDGKAVPAMVQDDAEIKQLVTDLDQKADPLHGDITPAVRKLGAIGERAIPYLQEPLSSSDENRRLHAQRALEGILQNRFGFVAGKGWTQPDGETKFVELWKRNGSYAYDAPDDQRQKAVAAWMAWHPQQAGN